jgi:hypothetical protein
VERDSGWEPDHVRASLQHAAQSLLPEVRTMTSGAAEGRREKPVCTRPVEEAPLERILW